MTDASAADAPNLTAGPSAPAATIVIPLRVSPALFRWEERLTRILATIPAGPFEILIVDYGTRAESRPKLQSIVREAGGAARLVRVDCEDEPFSIGKARDLGVMAARAPVILFNDIDFLAPRSTYEAIAAEIGRRELAVAFDRFFCVPVIFLSETGTRDYLAAERAAEFPLHHAAFRHRALDETSGVSVSIAYASSCMVANRLHYLALGGHDESFFGHGAEDFELLHRIAATMPRAPRPPAYYVDFKDNGITAYRGFRAAFALFGIEAFQSGLFLVHLHHPSRPSRDYNRRRKRNFRLLRRRMQQFDRTGAHPPPLPDPSRGRTLFLLQQGAPELEALRAALPLFGTLTFMDAGETDRPDQILQAFSDKQIDRILVADPHASPERMRAYQAVRGASVPFLAFGRGALPGSWFFDPDGFEADSRTYDRENWDFPLPNEARAATLQYLANLKAGGVNPANARAGPEVARLALGLSGGRKVLFVSLRDAGTDPASSRPVTDQVDETFLSRLRELGPELKRLGWQIVYSNGLSGGNDTSTPDAIHAPRSTHLLDLIELSDVVLSFGSAPGLLAAALGKPVISAGTAFYSQAGIAAVAQRPEEVLERLDAPSTPDAETVLRFVHYLRDKVYSFGEGSWEAAPAPEAGRIAPPSATIDFREIRGVTAKPVFLRRDASLLPLDSPVFASFGGLEAMQRAIRLASLQAANAGTEISASRRWTRSLALGAYQIAVGWRLPRRERILLKHAPEEVLAKSGRKHAARLLRFLAPDDPGR
ncbi:MAG: hypothetical protein H0T75_16385 [Rhizobiales bacterium]|nr:hypothetical protein [Hyphomicrobiales bacterium]